MDVRRDPDGTLDEIHADAAHVHVERLSECEWGLVIDTPDGTLTLALSTDTQTIHATIVEHV